MKTIYSAIYRGSPYPFDVLAPTYDVVVDPEQLTERDSMLVIWGGADISPKYYKHPLHSTTYDGGQRDKIEWALLQRAIEMGIPIAGVCRGAQMLCAAAGGYLLQDVAGHGGRHFVQTHDGKVFTVNSIHHQMMAGLENTEHELVAWATPPQSVGRYSYMDDKEFVPPPGWREAEFVYFPKIKGYAVQWHPEALRDTEPAQEYLMNYIQEKEEVNRSDLGKLAEKTV